MDWYTEFGREDEIISSKEKMIWFWEIKICLWYNQMKDIKNVLLNKTRLLPFYPKNKFKYI